MRALLCSRFGTAADLAVEDIADPVPGKGQVVVDVKAAALNFPDALIIAGKYQFKPEFPFSPGAEAAGVVSVVGEGVDAVKVGDPVIAGMMYGAFAEKVVVPATSLSRMPDPGKDSMDFHTAAGFGLAHGTSYHALKQRADLQPGETLLVLGAAGGVGYAAVELGKAMGAKVIAAASSDEKLETARAAGADEVINYTTEDLKARAKELSAALGRPMGVDVIYDPVGGDLAETALRSIGPGGRFLVIGFASGDIPKIPLNLALLKQCQIVGVFWGAWTQMDPNGHAENVAELFQMFDDGKIKPLVSGAYALDEYEAAYAELTERRVKGKIVFDMAL